MPDQPREAVDPVERLVNLALFLAGANVPVGATRVREEVYGYPPDQDDAAFLRMFERDKEVLRAAGLAIAEQEGAYQLDRDASFSSDIEVSAEQAVAIGAAAAACLSDPAFPFTDDLRLAIAKLGADLSVSGAPPALRLADEAPEQQGSSVALLSAAAQRRKSVAFTYTNASARTAPHDVDPYGLFVREGRWYLVARDRALDEIRTYAVARMADPEVNPTKPKSPDFERPDDFDVRSFIAMPFQYGRESDQFEAVLELKGPAPQLAEALAHHGILSESGGLTQWRVMARSRPRLMRFVVENAPAVAVVEPASLRQELATALGEVSRAHE